MSICIVSRQLTASLRVNLADALEAQVDVCAPAVEALQGDAAAKVLGVGAAQRQSVAQAGNGAAAAAGGGNGREAVAARGAGVLLVVGKGGEGVGPYVGEDVGGYAAAAVADADGDAGGVVVEGQDGAAAEAAGLVLGGGDAGDGAVRLVLEGGLGGNGDDDGLARLALDGGAKGVFEQLGDNVLEVHGDKSEGGVVGLAIDDELGADAVAQLANVGDEAGAGLDSEGGAEGRVDDANVRGVVRARGRAGVGVKVLLAAKVQGNVLLGDEAGADAGAQVAVEKGGDLGRGDVAAALEEALGEDGDGVGVGGDELGEDVGEAHLVVGRGNGAAIDGGLPVRQQDGQRVQVVVVDARDVGVGDDDEGQVAQRLDAVREADREEREGKVGRGEE